MRRALCAIGLTAATFWLGMFAPTAIGTGCLSSTLVVGEAGSSSEAGPVVTVTGDDPSKNETNRDAIEYRSLDGHPGCSTAGLATRAPGGATGAGAGYPPARIPGYRCAAKAYPTTSEDTQKPILLLVHGNSDAPSGWERWPTDTGANQLAETASNAGFRVFAVDFRVDLVDDPKTNNDTENAALNIDHGWAVPILEHLIESVLTAFPERKVSIVGFSLGPTVIRDALRRLHRANKKPFERVKDLVFGAGSHHGVSTFRALCGRNPTMRGKVACELGDRTAYQPTDFHKPLNGPDGAYETPCRDGDVAFGQKGVCGGNKVRYTTIVMKDKEDGTFQDEFVSEGSARLLGANNLTVPTTSPDTSKYFINGLFDDHYGAVRSDAALQLIMTALSAP